MNFESDLAQIIKQQFDEHNIFYEDNLDTNSLAARYLEMLNRRIAPIPRRVHFSEGIHESLGKLRLQADTEQQEAATEAWGAVFLIRNLIEEGKNVNGFLSTRIDHAAGRMSKDGLLWDFGMHHFHLSRKPHKIEKFRQRGFNKRSDYLLFAIVKELDVYFVDVVPHPNENRDSDYGWVRQKLVEIVKFNWPNLCEPYVLKGVTGGVVTDQDKKELRRKNVNAIVQIGNDVIAPMGGGLTTAGTSTLCQILADKFLNDLEKCQSYLETQPAEVKAALPDEGRNIDGDMEFKLVLLDSLGWPDEMVRSLKGNLHKTGFGIVEVTTHTFIDF